MFVFYICKNIINVYSRKFSFLKTQFSTKMQKKSTVHSIVRYIKRENVQKIKLVESELLQLLFFAEVPLMFINDNKRDFLLKFKSPFNEVLVLLKFSACVTKRLSSTHVTSSITVERTDYKIQEKNSIQHFKNKSCFFWANHTYIYGHFSGS